MLAIDYTMGFGRQRFSRVAMQRFNRIIRSAWKWSQSPSSSPVTQTTVFGMPRGEVVFVVFLTLVQIGLPAINFKPNFWLGLVIWCAVIGLWVHISWVTTPKWNNLQRLVKSTMAALLVTAFIYSPLRNQWISEHQNPTPPPTSVTPPTPAPTPV